MPELRRSLPTLAAIVLVAFAAHAQSGSARAPRAWQPPPAPRVDMAVRAPIHPLDVQSFQTCKNVPLVAAMGTIPPISRYFQPGILCEGINRIQFTDFNNATATATEQFAIGVAVGEVATIDLPLERHPVPLQPFVYGGQSTFVRPLVRRCVGGTAEPVLDGTFIYVLDAAPPVTGIGNSPSDQSFLYPAYWQPPGPNLYLLPGAFAALAGTISIDPATAQTQWVGQQVVNAPNVLLPAQTTSVLQTFGVPVTMTATGFDMGIDDVLSPAASSVRIYDLPGGFDASVDPLPPSFTLLPLAEVLDPSVLPAFVPTSAPAPGSLILRPGNLYGIWMPTNGTIGVRVSTSDDYPGGHAWYKDPNSTGVTMTAIASDLGFRVIGLPARLVPDPPSNVTFTGTPLDLGGSGVQLPQDLTGPPVAFAQPINVDGMTGFVVPYFPNRPALIPGAKKFALVSLFPGDINQPLDTYALDFVTLDPPSLGFGSADWHPFGTSRPIVVQPLQPEPWNSATATAIVVSGNESAFHLLPAFDPNAPGTLPAASFGVPGTLQPLPGVHPGIPIRVYTANDPTDPERVCVQQWRVSAGTAVSQTAELVETFRVAAPCRVDWMELAIPSGGDVGPGVLHVSIGDAAAGLDNIIGADDNVVDLPSRSLDPGQGVLTGVWRATPEVVTATATLEPNHDYAIVIRADSPWSVGSCTVTSTLAQEGVVPPDPYPNGALYIRGAANAPWVPLPGDLSFRLIGRAAATTAVPRAPVVARPIRLEAAPNPFRGVLTLRWSGGSGVPEIEIADVAGRVVRRMRPDATTTQWTWDGSDGDGRRMNPGVYFVRLARGPANSAIRRVVLLR